MDCKSLGLVEFFGNVGGEKTFISPLGNTWEIMNKLSHLISFPAGTLRQLLYVDEDARLRNEGVTYFFSCSHSVRPPDCCQIVGYVVRLRRKGVNDMGVDDAIRASAQGTVLGLSVAEALGILGFFISLITLAINYQKYKSSRPKLKIKVLDVDAVCGEDSAGKIHAVFNLYVTNKSCCRAVIRHIILERPLYPILRLKPVIMVLKKMGAPLNIFIKKPISGVGYDYFSLYFKMQWQSFFEGNQLNDETQRLDPLDFIDGALHFTGNKDYRLPEKTRVHFVLRIITTQRSYRKHVFLPRSNLVQLDGSGRESSVEQAQKHW